MLNKLNKTTRKNSPRTTKPHASNNINLTTQNLLQIQELSVLIQQKRILQNINLLIKPGEVTYIVGPNGSGKSMLLKSIAGVALDAKIQGQIIFKGKDITNLPPEKRAQLGMFLAWQKPPAIPEITVEDYLKAISSTLQTTKQVEDLLKQVKLPEAFAKKPLNLEMSGGQIKKLELASLLLLEPSLILLDELDSGLDVESEKFVFNTIHEYLHKHPQVGTIVVSHGFRVAQILKPHTVYILQNGKLSKPYDSSIIQKLQKHGFKQFD